MTGCIKYNFIQLQFSELYSVEKYCFSSIENGNFAVNKQVISHKSLHERANWLKIGQVQTILNILTESSILYYLYSQSSIQCKSTIFLALFIYILSDWLKSISSVF